MPEQANQQPSADTTTATPTTAPEGTATPAELAGASQADPNGSPNQDKQAEWIAKHSADLFKGETPAETEPAAAAEGEDAQKQEAETKGQPTPSEQWDQYREASQKAAQERRAKLELEQGQATVKEAAELKERLLSDPFGVVREIGGEAGVQQLIREAIAGDSGDQKEATENPDVAEAKRIAEEARKEAAALKEQQKQGEIARQTEAVKADIRAEVAKSDQFPLLQEQGQEELVFDLILAEHRNTGRVPSIAESAKQVEAYLGAQLQKLLSTPRAKAAAAKILGVELQADTSQEPPKQQPAPQAPAQPTAKPAAAPTLTNSGATGGEVPARPQFRNDEERMAHIVQLTKEKYYNSP
jgi:hypothetical protein